MSKDISLLNTKLQELSCPKRASFNQSLYENDLKSLGVPIKELRKLGKEFSDIDISLLLLNEYFEYIFLFFFIGLKRCFSLEEQVSFVLKNKSHLLSWAITDSLENSFYKLDIQDEIKILTSLKNEGSYCYRLALVILMRYLKEDHDEIYSFIEDREELEVKKAIAWLLATAYCYEEDKVLSFAKALSLKTRRLLVSKIRDSYRVSKESKQRAKLSLL